MDKYQKQVGFACLFIVLAAVLGLAVSFFAPGNPVDEASNNSAGSPVVEEEKANNSSGSLGSSELEKIKVSGALGEEPVVVVPKGLNVSDEDKAFLRDGEGELILADDFVSFKIQKVAIGEEEKIYSSWKLSDIYNFSAELGEDFAPQTEPWIRENFPGKHVGASFAIVETTSKRSLFEFDNLTDAQIEQRLADSALKDKVQQIWVVTIVKREPGTQLPVHLNEMNENKTESKEK